MCIRDRHGIVRGHQGVVQVQSQPGEGSTFHVFLPAVAPVPFDEGQGGSPVDDTANGVGQHVIYVDDDEVMVLMVQRLLQRAGYQVTTCTAPAQLLALLREQPALGDLVVSDYNMPEMSGVELAIELARLRPALPVVISSGYIADELRQQARAVGVRALLKKENTLEELPELLAASDQDLLDRHGRWYIAGRDPRHLRRNALLAWYGVLMGALGVRLGAPWGRGYYAASVALAFVLPVLMGLAGGLSSRPGWGLGPAVMLVLGALPLASGPIAQVRSGASGRALLPVLGMTARLQLWHALLLCVGLLVDRWLGGGMQGWPPVL